MSKNTGNDQEVVFDDGERMACPSSLRRQDVSRFVAPRRRGRGYHLVIASTREIISTAANNAGVYPPDGIVKEDG